MSGSHAFGASIKDLAKPGIMMLRVPLLRKMPPRIRISADGRFRRWSAAGNGG
jgi:hypothetical protein